MPISSFKGTIPGSEDSIKLQDTTPRIEDSVNIHEGSNNHKTTKATREASTLQDLNL
jgi:hypothetical protein